MKCPFCGKENTRVIDSRPSDDDSSIRRRRQCDKCSKRFTTYENVETIPFVVIKKDMTREPYDRTKLEAGVFRSCHKRPISLEQICAVIDKVEAAIYEEEKREISTTAIGEMVLEQLKQLDSVAYIRFASVYREFEDMNTFMKEIEMLQKKQ
ncbi:MAG: transcriptional repressor NrdR [Lachnospiraceae bacterium]|nr:transcriptional repressor NrdR [Lachnospiraceae bacterium]